MKENVEVDCTKIKNFYSSKKKKSYTECEDLLETGKR